MKNERVHPHQYLYLSYYLESGEVRQVRFTAEWLRRIFLMFSTILFFFVVSTLLLFRQLEKNRHLENQNLELQTFYLLRD